MPSTCVLRSVAIAVSSSCSPGLERQLPGRCMLLQLVLDPRLVGVLGPDPVVALIFEELDELGSAALDDTPAVEDMDEPRLDVVQDALVVRDDEDARPDPRHDL